MRRSDAMNEVQGRFYKVGAEIARLEQSIQHSRELRQRQQRDLEQTESGLKEIYDYIEKDEAQIQDLSQTLGKLQPELEAAKAIESASLDALRSAEADMQQWQQRWEEFNKNSGEATSAAEVEKARIESLETEGHRLITRRERCAEDMAQASDRLEDPQIADLATAEAAAVQAVSDIQKELDKISQGVVELREEDRTEATRLDEMRGDLQKRLGHLASLEALQQAAMGQQSGSVNDWLDGQGWQDRPRLAHEISVSKGWERAVETVLGSYLEAVCVDGILDVTKALDSLTHGTVSFLEAATPGGQPEASTSDSLASKIEGQEAVRSLISNVRAVDSLAEALKVAKGLGPGESVVSRDGIWMGPGWLRVSRDSDEEAGVLAREQEIRQQRDVVATLEEEVQGLTAHHDTVRTRLEEVESKREELQRKLNEAHQHEGDVRGKLKSASARVEETQDRLKKLKAEAAEIDAHTAEADESIRLSRTRLEDVIGKMSIFEAQREELESQRAALEASVEKARAKAQESQDAAQEIAIKTESRKSTRDSATVALERLRAQVTQYGRRREELREQLDSGESPLEDDQKALNTLLDSRVGVDSELGQARDSVQQAENEMRALQQHRQLSERDTDEARQKLDELRLAKKEVSVRRQTV
jgi:chromosome segregation protein